MARTSRSSCSAGFSQSIQASFTVDAYRRRLLPDRHAGEAFGLYSIDHFDDALGRLIAGFPYTLNTESPAVMGKELWSMISAVVDAWRHDVKGDARLGVALHNHGKKGIGPR